ncbi:UDP-glucose 4-epimerase GalE [Thalassobaculum sp. OXR-137]|uniref:UDP-glucose 4-epimerase GalE n=1 Tax=Thalassobaculum sp. OXR-137 TaxID=3100173 RepID=UPI002AC9EF4B|nr:UDP-glucose 4-epimerase GalE [Thalassobaculum sp. OXR-137]WPZ37049.1 UDP-glucose 4-epimerase GalE [Thalassobaculum sp. OXR-137]
MARVLVTGGAGYVGSHACKALARAGHEPIVLDNLSQGHRALVRWGPLVVGDIADPVCVDGVFREYRPDAVMHFAAIASVGESMVDPAVYYRINIGGTMTILDAMRDHDVAPLVFSSSCAVYGCPPTALIVEESSLEPVNPYGASKKMMERIIADYGQAYGHRSLCLRYFNAGGADPDGEAGESHDPETHVIPLLLMAATGRIPQFDIYGTDYPTPDGSAIRDYVHVSDLAEAHVAALDYLLQGGASTVVNLGTGCGTSVLQLIDAVERATGRTVPRVARPRRPGDPPILVASNEKAGRVLGWRPRMTEPVDMIATAHAWMERPLADRRAVPVLAAGPQAHPLGKRGPASSHSPAKVRQA